MLREQQQSSNVVPGQRLGHSIGGTPLGSPRARRSEAERGGATRSITGHLPGIVPPRRSGADRGSGGRRRGLIGRGRPRRGAGLWGTGVGRDGCQESVVLPGGKIAVL